jgi:hypothetical protein
MVSGTHHCISVEPRYHFDVESPTTNSTARYKLQKQEPRGKLQTIHEISKDEATSQFGW